MRDIPIRNIYTMLCYSWGTLSQESYKLLGSEEFDNIHNLLASVLLSGCSLLLKRGLYHEYIEQNEDMYSVAGKINLTNSIKNNTLIKGHINCNYENYIINSKFNKIIKSTILLMCKNKYIKKDLIKQLKNISRYFNQIDAIDLKQIQFEKLSYTRNDSHYKQILHICELFYNGLIVNEDHGTLEFANFIKDHKMAKLYENFVLNFYKVNLDKKNFKVHSPKIDWNLNEPISEKLRSILPQMCTDITIENKLTKKQLIIDTKYYSETLTSSKFSETEKIRTAHLYQLNTYLQNLKSNQLKSGILLYPTVNKNFDETMTLNDNIIRIKTINLNDEWCYIENELIKLSEF